MSLLSRAASSLVESLDKFKHGEGSKGSFVKNEHHHGSTSSDLDDDPRQTISAPPRPPLSTRDGEMEEVLKLDVPRYDHKRQFPGLAKLKIEKKERHNKALDDFGKLLDNISEELEQNVLQLSLEMRESLENSDASFQAYYRTLEDNQFLIVRSEPDLVVILGESRERVAQRSAIVESFAHELDALEVKRADIAGAELKKLVDKLIGIAHQLPDEIEHIVENETFDLNKVLTANRESHAKLLVMLRKTQVQVEAETIQRWEDARRKWRQLRHDKGIQDFLTQIYSAEFTDPMDRQSFLAKTRKGQGQRYDLRCDQLNILASLTADNISSRAVETTKERFSAVSESEMTAMQDCYNGLTGLRTRLRFTAEERVELLRKELHVYGFLEPEPDLVGLAGLLQSAIDDPTLSELWRLGGGLKTEFLSMIGELLSEEVVYDRVMLSVQERLEMIVCSFGLKSILEERGRLPQLDRIRNMIVKLRNVVRGESAAVVKGLMPLLEEILDVEAVPTLFKQVVRDCLEEMTTELTKIDDAKELARTAQLKLDSSAASVHTASTSQSSEKETTRKSGKSQQSGKSARGSSTRGSVFATGSRSRGGGEEENADMYVDPISLKMWNRKLGILYFGSDLPESVQLDCIHGIDSSIAKMACNKAVDAVVKSQSEKILRRMDKRYKKLIDFIANFLEAQENAFVTCANNVTDFFLRLAKMVEEHRKLQSTLDERSADDLWDLSEDFRLEREDREEQFEAACQRLRASAESESLQENFAAVLNILTDIEESYRVYHGKACFASDRYPLYLIDEFKRYTTTMASMFDMIPYYKHPILISYDEIYDETLRLNKKHFEGNPAAGGVAVRGPDRDSASPEQKRLAAAAKEAAEAAAAAANTGKKGSVVASPVKSKKGSVVEAPVEVVDVEPTIYDSPNLVAIVNYQNYVEEQEALEKLSGGSTVKRDKGALTDVFGRPIPQPPVPEEPTIPSMAGMFAVQNPLGVVAHRFTLSATTDAEGSSGLGADGQPIDDGKGGNAAAVAALGTESTKGGPGTAGNAVPTSSAAHTPSSPSRSSAFARELHPSFPWLLRDTPVLPISRNDLLALSSAEDPEDLIDYKESLAQSFVPLSEFAIDELMAAVEEEGRESAAAEAAASKGAAKAGKGAPVPAPVTEAPPSDGLVKPDPPMKARLEAYRICEEIYREIRAIQAAESEPSYLLEHVPVREATGEPWVLQLEMSRESMEQLVAGIRDSVMVAVEREAYRRIDNAKALTGLRKGELTEELEGRLRMHWPRRGRVETQIKQPREAELLSHEEKTWRHIRAIQTRMTDIQRKFFTELAASETARREYVEGILTLKASLTSQTFRNLASLQVYDVNARRKTLDYQSACASQLQLLNRVCDDDIASAIFFANDFRKVCPAQVPGVEGGYSEAELNEIESLVRGQREEIVQVADEWRGQIALLKERQDESLRNQEEFTAVYENVALDLAMSEGLGQKYGAPRRRAGEKIRTAVTRDEQAAGKVDELLAQLEFICTEEQRREDAGIGGGFDSASVVSESSGAALASSAERLEQGRSQLKEVNRTWGLLNRVRIALRQRVAFLKVEDVPVVYSDLGWLTVDRYEQKMTFADDAVGGGDVAVSEGKGDEINAVINGGAAQAAAAGGSEPVITLQDVVEETDSACREETKEMYRNENKIALLDGTSTGVPESLQTWLTEVKEKILGVKGHREKAWKRLWGQVGRLESIFSRKQVEDDGQGAEGGEETEVSPSAPSSSNAMVVASAVTGVPGGGVGSVLTALRVGAPAVCLRLLTESLLVLVKNDREHREARFAQRIAAWELVKEKHERFLRPVLGSPERSDDLAQLDRMEKERSNDLTSNVIKFRKILLSRLLQHARNFFDDITITSRNLMQLLDSTVYRELLLIPPDTTVPKKRMTLKRLRKAQRLREEVSSGQEARSIERVWPSISLDPATNAAASAEASIQSDLVRDPAYIEKVAKAAHEATLSEQASLTTKEKKPPRQGSASTLNVAPVVEEKLLPEKWMTEVMAGSAVRGGVSTAHRCLIAERDAAVQRYSIALAIAVEEVASHCNTLLQQEDSWIQRWNRQVAMLVKGQL